MIINPLKHDISDPSGGKGTERLVEITSSSHDPGPGDISATEKDTNIVFDFSFGTPDNYLFTGFRYMRITKNREDRFEYGGWASPSNDPNWPRDHGKRNHYTSETCKGLSCGKGVRIMTIVDENNYNVIYLYLVEYTDGTNTFVFDPKIRNQPAVPPEPGGLPPGKSPGRKA